MSGMEGSSAPVIGRDESRLRVMAGCAATIIAAWTIYAASQIASASDWKRWLWVLVSAVSAFDLAVPLARAFGRQKGRASWLFTGSYAFYFPFLWLMSVSIEPFSPGGGRLPFDTGGSPPRLLAIASMLVLLGLAMAGSALEKLATLPHRQPSGR